jgi:hypothetical protein
LLILLTGVFAGIFAQARSATEGGSKRVALQGQHRIAQRRLTTLLRSAVPPNEVTPALVWPEVGQTESTSRFFAPANLLDSDEPFDPRLPNYVEYTVELTPGNTLKIQRTDGLGPEQIFGREITSAQFLRQSNSTLEVRLTSNSTVRGAAGSSKTVEETSRNLILIPSIR